MEIPDPTVAFLSIETESKELNSKTVLVRHVELKGSIPIDQLVGIVPSKTIQEDGPQCYSLISKTRIW